MLYRLMPATVSLLIFTLFITLLALTQVVPVRAAPPTTLTVTSVHDAVDAVAGDGICADETGECTLRAAVQESNTRRDVERIVVPAGVYTFTLAGTDEDASATGDLDITASVTITGDSADRTIIDGNRLDRVFHISNTHVEISGVTIRNGEAPGNGGGIMSSASELTIDRVAIINNTSLGMLDAQGGGGIYNGGWLTITNSLVENNTASVYENVRDDGTRWWSGGDGGAIRSHNAFEEPSFEDPTLVIDNSTIARNEGKAYSGGISAERQSVLIKNSTLTENKGGMDSTGGAVNGDGPIRIVGSTISRNQAGSASAVAAGTSRLVVLNSTISGNGNGSSSGSTIDAWNVTLINATVANNKGSEGGALRGSFTVANSLLAFNSPANCHEGVAVTSEGYNLSSDGSCPLSQPTDQVNVNPRLGRLADSRGRPWTHPLLPGGPAIDAGNPATPDSKNFACTAYDQRGQRRDIDGDGDGEAVCDIAAHEFFVPALTLSDAEQLEGNADTSTATFVASLSVPSRREVRVDYLTEGGTAAVGEDYTPVAGTLIIPPGRVTATIEIPIIEDSTYEADETFSLHLSNPRGVEIKQRQWLGTILNDDNQPIASITNVRVKEDGVALDGEIPAAEQAIAFLAARREIDEQAMAVTSIEKRDWANSALGCPRPDTRYLAVVIPGYLIVIEAAGETFQVHTNDDASHMVLCENGEPTAIEVDGPIASAVFTVTLSNPSVQPVRVEYHVEHGSSQDEDGNIVLTGTQSFTPGETSRIIRITLKRGEVQEDDDRRFHIRLAGAANAQLDETATIMSIPFEQRIEKVFLPALRRR